MDINDCIRQYWIMSTSIFRPYHMRLVRMYSRRALQEAAKSIAQDYCNCHDREPLTCQSHTLLRQHDFEEAFENGSLTRKNKTCKV